MQAVSLDLAGTIIDRGNQIPFLAFKLAFEMEGINIYPDEIFMFMGMNKREHIQNILQLPQIKRSWVDYHRMEPTEDDVDRIFRHVSENVVKLISKDSLPFFSGFYSIFETCKENRIPIMITTGYDRLILNNILYKFEKRGVKFQATVASNEVKKSRPFPDMLIKACEMVGVSPKLCIKIGDTDMDVSEGKNAGAITIRTLYDGLTKEKRNRTEINNIMLDNLSKRQIPDYYALNLRKASKIVYSLIKKV